MRKFILFAAIVSAAAILGGGCTKQPASDKVSVFEVTVDEAAVSTTSADIRLTSANIIRYAYLLQPESVPASADVIFAAGTSGDIVSPETVVSLTGLEPETEYTVYFAAQVDESTYFADVVPASFTTAAFTGEATIYNITPRSFALHVNLPQEAAARVAAGVSAIRSATYDIVTYNLKSGDYLHDAELLANSGYDKYYPDNVHTTTSFTRIFDDAHMHPTGEGWDNPDDTADAYYFYPIVPGQPNVVLMGEFGKGEFGYPEEGWYNYLPYFDENKFLEENGFGWLPWSASVKTSSFLESTQEKYWSGFYKCMDVITTQPEPLAASVSVNAAITPIGGRISLVPDAGVSQYIFSLIPTDLYEYSIKPLLNNHDEFMQWFITSFAAYLNIGIYTAYDPVEVEVGDFLYGLMPNESFELCVVAMGDPEGNSQSYAQYTYTIPESTKPAPEIAVAPIANPNGTEDPYEVWFNIKRTGSEPVYSFKYAANDKMSWDSMASWYSDDEIVEFYGNNVDEPSIIAAVNSAEGFNVSFFSRDGDTTVLAVKAMHDEGVYCAAVTAQNTTVELPAAPRVESDLFTALQGDWTMTVPLKYDTYDDFFNLVTYETVLTGKVSVGDVGYPDVLPDEVYEIYRNSGDPRYQTDEQIAALYNEFKATVDTFNSKTGNRNRILMNGFPGNIDWSASLSDELLYRSPYDLFVSPDYNGATVDNLVWDFGPKWFLEIGADGTVTVPVNGDLNPPLTNASGWSPWHNIVVSEYGSLAVLDNHKTIAVPVEVSADRNTITIKAFKHDGIDYFLGCGAGSDPAWLTYYGRTCGEIVLTRGWTDTASAQTQSAAAPKVQARKTAMPQTAGAHRLLGRTPLPEVKGRTRVIKAAPVTKEQFEAGVERCRNRIAPRRR